MNRRHFLTIAAAGAMWPGCSTLRPAPRLGHIMTVLGAVEPEALGITLSHEHLLVDFTPVGDVGPHRYERADVVARMLPYLLEIRELGVRAFVDATPAYLGRDPLVLRALSEQSGLHILTNTGYYGAREDAHLPDHVHTETADVLAQRWIAEWRGGIDGTAVRPGFMKIGVDTGPLSDVDAKLARAAAIAHRSTGLTIASHTGPSDAAFEQLDLLKEAGVHPAAWIWVHAQAETDRAAHVEAARRGAWVAFDGVRPDAVDAHVELVLNMHRHNLLDHVLVSQDAGWYRPGEPDGGDVRGFGTLVRDFVPALQAAGLGEHDVDRLLRRNPAEAFRIRIRHLNSGARRHLAP